MIHVRVYIYILHRIIYIVCDKKHLFLRDNLYIDIYVQYENY